MSTLKLQGGADQLLPNLNSNRVCQVEQADVARIYYRIKRVLRHEIFRRRSVSFPYIMKCKWCLV